MSLIVPGYQFADSFTAARVALALDPQLFALAYSSHSIGSFDRNHAVARNQKLVCGSMS
jgi:hypothetical protein